MLTKKFSKSHLIYVLFLVFYIWMAAQIPYTHDDWDWGLDVGMQQWLSASVNSRYVGNFFEIIMTRSVLLKTVIMGLSFFTLPCLLSRLAANTNEKSRLVLFIGANLLLLTMSRMIWSETYGWVAGFANFTLSSIFALLCMMQWSKLFDPDFTVENRSPLNHLLWIFITLCTQLFIENLSIVMFALSLGACIGAYFRAKKVPTYYISMSVGAALGLCIMFSSSVYTSLFHTGEAVDGYRQLIISGEGGLMAKLYDIFVQAARLVTRAGETNYVLCVSVLGVLTWKTLTKKVNLSKALKAVVAVVNISYIVYFTVSFMRQTDYTFDQPVLAAIGAAINAVYFAVAALEVILIYKDNRYMQLKLIAVWLIGISLLAPLLVTNEAGYRLVFSLNVMVILFVLIVLQDILNHASMNTHKGTASLLLIGTAAAMAVCAVVYSAIGSCNNTRLEIIAQAADSQANEIVLPDYPYQNYLHAANPIDENRWRFFKEFYGINGDVIVTIASDH